ncbi:hypothetical protein [Chryseobacterium oncorhynchi]|uniref:Uncharacterized protein n=1 Tax=Chryseobacterium oncorhynchi TaxID=741074 RepID=A0A316WST5_9FLAO|nr:hypothetical protein [Chryseobacterium oncorhynchi]PWN62278.1 hypothetical protein C1638_017445 [Chryseobacterium oncorhynchi]
MSKPTKKRQSYNTDILNVLSEEFEVSTRFVRMSIRKEKQSRTADNIRKKYYEMIKPTQDAIEQFKNQ